MIDYLLVLPLFLMAAYYIGAPVLLYVSQKITANPTLQPAVLGTLPPELIHYFIENAERLAGEGFKPLNEYVVSGNGPDAQTVLVLLAHPETGDRALIIAQMLRFHSEWQPLMQYVEISARFEDGSRVCVNNRVEPDWFSAPATKRTFCFATARDCRELCRLHRRAVAWLASDALPVHVPLESDAAGLLLQDFREDCEAQRRAGILFLDAQQGTYQPTLRGAFLLSWRLLLPFRAALLIQDRARASALRAKLLPPI